MIRDKSVDIKERRGEKLYRRLGIFRRAGEVGRDRRGREGGL